MRFGIFDEYVFDEDMFDTIDIYDQKAPGAIPLNAYKAYKTLREFRGEPRFNPPPNLAEE